MSCKIITCEKLKRAMEGLGYNPNPRYIQAIVDVTNERFTDHYTAAMFLGQCAHECTGYADIEEQAYAGATQSPYGGGAPGKSYHGRGFIQLSWPGNYSAASRDLGKGDHLYRNPEQVASDPRIGAEVSVWYWKTVVEKAANFSPYHNFGVTTRAINGQHECNGQNEGQSRNRYRCYVAICSAMGIKPADERGCYN